MANHLYAFREVLWLLGYIVAEIPQLVAAIRAALCRRSWPGTSPVGGLTTGRLVRILRVVGAFTRACLALEAEASLGSGRLTLLIEQLIDERGLP